jgi:ABC-type multidrug transport system fused ATPase/permease subunit
MNQIDGRIEFRNVSLRYRSDLAPALVNISFTVEAGQRVGIIGRTGMNITI